MAAELTPLPEVERLSPACIRILGGNPGKFTLQGTNTYLIGTGSTRLLIDTGEGKPSWIAAMKRTLQSENASIKSALLTHWHHDHVGGVADLLENCPDTPIYKCKPSDEGWKEIVDGQIFEVEGATLTAAHTPGHTIDHMGFVLREEDALFTGDNVLGQGTSVFEDLATYIKSLKRMETLVSGRGYPAHGPVLPDARATVSEYIAHRHERELQVLETLEASKAEESFSTPASGQPGTWSPVELVKIIYRDYPESLHPAAVGGVIQILQKLQKEEKVVLEADGRWILKERSTL